MTANISISKKSIVTIEWCIVFVGISPTRIQYFVGGKYEEYTIDSNTKNRIPNQENQILFFFLFSF